MCEGNNETRTISKLFATFPFLFNRVPARTKRHSSPGEVIIYRQCRRFVRYTISPWLSPRYFARLGRIPVLYSNNSCLCSISPTEASRPRATSRYVPVRILIENLLTPITSRATAFALIVDVRRSSRKRGKRPTISKIVVRSLLENFHSSGISTVGRLFVYANHATRRRSGRKKTLDDFISNDREIVET